MLPTVKKYILLTIFLIISTYALLYFSGIKSFVYSLIRADTGPRSSGTDRTPDGLKQIRELIKKNKYTNIKDNIILITIDTARTDHFRCYGNSKIDTPNIDKLADNGVLFENAISPAPITMVSHSSMFTGLYPYAHGIRENGIFYLNNKFLTLAEILKANGYTTAAFVSSYPLHSQFNLGQGFDHYDDQFTRLLTRRQEGIMRWQGHKITEFERPADKVTLNYLNWLIPNSDKKFFTWIHYFDPHKSYQPPYKYKKKYGNQPENLYKGEISFVDECIGYVFNYINTLKVNNNTMIIIAADHGESLGERNYWGHALELYDNATKVPLIFYHPSKLPQGKRIKDQVSIIDILPTILHIRGIAPPPNIHGRDFSALLTGTGHSPDHVTFSETLFPQLRRKRDYKLFSIRTNNWKIVKHIFTHEDKNKIELFNLIDDPAEQNNLAGEPHILSHVNPLLEELDVFINKSKKVNRKNMKPLTEKTKKALKALGYIQ